LIRIIQKIPLNPPFSKGEVSVCAPVDSFCDSLENGLNENYSARMLQDGP
jgi:hypothetical protein